MADIKIYGKLVANTEDQTVTDASSVQDSTRNQKLNATLNTLVNNISTLETTVGGKQGSLSETQLSAVNSGITENKVTAYDEIVTIVNGLGSAASKNVGTASGNLVALDSSGKLPTSVLPALAITNTFVVESEAAMTALSAQQGDIAVRTDQNKCYILTNDTPSVASNWQVLLTPTQVIPTKLSDLNNDTGFITSAYHDSSKQDALSNDQLAAANSGITSTKVSNYDTHIADTDVHVTQSDKVTWNNKQNALTFDNTPTTSSINPVTSDGIKTALDGKQNALPAIVNDRYLHTNSSTGTLEWSEVKTGIQVVELTTQSGTLSDSDYAILSGNNGVILYQNNYAIKDYENASYIFYKSSLTSYSNGLLFNNIQITKSSKTYFISNLVSAIDKVSANPTLDGTEAELLGLKIGNTKRKIFPTKVNDRYLHTNSSTGDLEWAEVVTGTQVVELASGIGTLSDADFAKVSGNDCVIKYGNDYLFRSNYDSSKIYYRQIRIVDYGNWISSVYCEINISSKNYSIGSAQLVLKVSANPTLTGTEAELLGLQVGSTKHKIFPTKVNDRYLHTNADTGALEWAEVSGGMQVVSLSTSGTLTADQFAILDGDDCIISNNESYFYKFRSFPTLRYYKIEIDSLASGNNHYVRQRYFDINRDTLSYSLTENPLISKVYANPTLAGTETELLGLQIGSTKHKIFPTKVNDRYLHTNATTGELEWTSVSSSSASQMTSITYADLVTLKTGGTLTPGMKYRITDYTCTTTTEHTSSAGHVFDIIVTATSTDTLSEEAQAGLHSGDTYFANSKLSAWKLWYSLENDTDRFAWADRWNGKGVIYRMIDEFGNDCPYDFKNILFSDNSITDYTFSNKYTFSKYDDGEATIDASLSGLLYCSDNIIKPYMYVYTTQMTHGKYQLNFIVIYAACTGNIYVTKNFFDYGCKNIRIKIPINSETNVSNNVFGKKCYYIALQGDCEHNTFMQNCNHIYANSDLEYNTFMQDCESIYLGARYKYNTFMQGCHSITFGTSSSTVIDYVKNVIFEAGCYSIQLYSNDIYPDNANWLQNIRIGIGIHNQTISVPDRNLDYEMSYKMTGSTEVLL